MGSEGSGMHEKVKESCDGIVSIPTCGNVDSLNVSVAAGVLMYEVKRQQSYME
ncbi:MAG: 23S rRNA (guanosine(2251)-2'-O)-methyltransferase RlmB, partial [Spirochaetales bacterium]|nr:23S rRNA (guanosine(2251)-2'-O)-methyltransferase RlmB [Spirochaetales bacterium]